MIISDLNHLEVVSEASSVVGGKLDIDIATKLNQKLSVKGANIGLVNQVALGVAISLDGKAIAKADNKIN